MALRTSVFLAVLSKLGIIDGALPSEIFLKSRLYVFPSKVVEEKVNKSLQEFENRHSSSYSENSTAWPSITQIVGAFPRPPVWVSNVLFTGGLDRC